MYLSVSGKFLRTIQVSDTTELDLYEDGVRISSALMAGDVPGRLDLEIEEIAPLIEALSRAKEFYDSTGGNK